MLASRMEDQAECTQAQLARLKRMPVLRGYIEPSRLVFPETGQWREAPTHTVGGRRILAVSALADPRSFYAMLRGLEADLVGVLEYPDHHQYTTVDWQNIWRAAANVEMIVTTEKDLVKLERFPFPRGSVAALRLEVSMGADEERLLSMALGEQRAASLPVTELKRGA
jgi:tetraacyldisaccharide-1-P 4'-kinase